MQTAEKRKIRMKMFEKFSEQNLSQNLITKICRLFKNIKENEKEMLAEKVLMILNSTTDENKIEQEILKIKKSL